MAPWHELSDALVIETAPDTVKVVVAPAARSRVSPVWSAKAAPVAALQAAPLSEVMPAAGCFVTVVIRTGKGFGLVTRIFAVPVAPG